MIIKSIKLINFRNHTEYYLECLDNTSLILGANGCGKTSVLEAIYILTRGKSFRATDPDIVKKGSTFYRIELEYQNGEKNIVTYDGHSKTFFISDKKSKRLPKKNKHPVILFLPSDLNLISHSPSRRRDYFDFIFSEFDEKYNSCLLKYEKAIKQRNELLKKEQTTSDDVFSWNVILAKYGVDLYNFRKKFIQEINSKLTPTYHSIAENNDQINLLYKTDVTDMNDSDYLKRLDQDFRKDLYLGHTTFGVHKDDYIFEFNSKPANGSASRGETRSIVLALKFIEADLIYQKQHQKPIILLDDVFSELDDSRRKCLVKNFKDNQVIITSVEDISNY
ncbi:DNA replication and repair protein RecF [Candidatus Saccharibacteria bacterium]|nr:DNA replication and repair protein RecF [Candidatus Saccharibacteria bacterium]